jgi:predicted lipoprotein with Yx(FWY)xxD motif
MPAQPKPWRARRPRRAALVALVAGVGLAVITAAAVAKTLTLKVAKQAQVTNLSTMATTLENIAVNSHGKAVYTLSGETIHHVKCTKGSGCLNIWLPVTATSAKKLAKANGIKGKLRLWHRGHTSQVTLNGHPLYTFVVDTSKNHATGEGIKSFNGTWHVVKASGAGAGGSSPPSSPGPGSMPPYPNY